MNWIDAIVIAVAILAALRGWRRGLVGQVFELGGGFIGLLIGVAVGPRVASIFTDQAGLQAALISLVVVFLALSVGQTIGFLVGHRFHSMARDARFGELDQATGAGFGVIVWLLAFWLIGSMLVGGPSRSLARSLKESAILRAASDVMPKPPNILAYLRQYLETSGFPQVFAGLPPVSEPVDLPPDRVVRRAVETAADSTVRIVVQACGGTQLGSGWISDDDSVVTNAHVVAGGDNVTIQELSGEDVSGQVVLFDPRTDLAVIHVPDGLSAPTLELETAAQDRGTVGATLGYPGDAEGEFVPTKAAVQATYEATGRDIYGEDLVTREVYELRARVEQGDSGGPFVLPDGRVAGVVFAASTTDAGTGYALTGAEAEDEVEQGSRRTQTVSTGPCTR
ncbi:MAG: MarP family serine protease [Actinomycetota bacterium]